MVNFPSLHKLNLQAHLYRFNAKHKEGSLFMGQTTGGQVFHVEGYAL